jgi:hypothetical protein
MNPNEGGGGVAGPQPVSTAVHVEPKETLRFFSICNLLPMTEWKGGRKVSLKLKSKTHIRNERKGKES